MRRKMDDVYIGRKKQKRIANTFVVFPKFSILFYSEFDSEIMILVDFTPSWYDLNALRPGKINRDLAYLEFLV